MADIEGYGRSLREAFADPDPVSRNRKLDQASRRLMMQSWRESLEDAEIDAAMGDADAAKDVQAWRLWIDMHVRHYNQEAMAELDEACEEQGSVTNFPGAKERGQPPSGRRRRRKHSCKVVPFPS
jgi:hypothetical protein